jgi:hypothetical protein
MATKIYTVTDLQNIENDLEGDYELANDIDASETSTWNGGAGFEPISYFEGTFDSKGYEISNLFIDRPTENHIGLFASIASGASVIDVTLTSIDITGKYYVGGLAGGITSGVTIHDIHTSGEVNQGTSFGYAGGIAGECSSPLKDCSSSVIVTGSKSHLGGLIGQQSANLTDCSATGNVTSSGDDYIGGLVGSNDGGIMRRCFATGNVSGIDQVGGLVGRNTIPIFDSYATGSVSGTDAVGGLCGYNSEDIENSYSVGAVTGSTNVGGLIGEMPLGSTTDCFWDIQTSGQATSAGGTGKTTSQMKDIDTFPWDIKRTLAGNPTGGYPFLGWQEDLASTWAIYEGEPESPRRTATEPIEDKITLETIREMEMAAQSRFFIDEEGKATYKSRFARSA